MIKTAILFVVLGAALPAADAPSDLRAWLQSLAFQQLETRREAVSRISTRAEAEARGRFVRKALLRLMGGLPAEHTPLRLRKAGAIDRGSYRIEKVIFESLPEFYVTANLYVPQTGSGPFPAVLQPVGHSTAAKSRAFYQTLALGLVKSGFVVLTYDPLGQGERRIFYDADLGDSKVGGGTNEHEVVGIQRLLSGESIAREMVWDGIRGIDLLESLPYVDRARIGVAGCSGGGTITAYLAALDDRVKAAAPACYITSWEEQLAGTGPQDAEQQFPDQLKEGLDHGDFAIAFAPRPYLQVNTTEDFFPIAGARRTFEESRRIYGLFGSDDRIRHAVGPGGHGMPKNVREEIYGWMNHWLKGGPAAALPEPQFQTEYEEDLYCTATGQVSTSLHGETASSLYIKRHAQTRPERPPLKSPANVEALRERLRREMAQLTRYRPAAGPVRVTLRASARREGYTVRRLTYDVSGSRTVSAWLAEPDTPTGNAVLMAFEAGGEAALRPGAEGDSWARKGHPVLAIDVAGFGTSAGKWAGYSDDWFGPEKLAWLALMTGESLPALGTEDILRALDVLADQRLLGAGCTGVAHGITGVALLHAAALDTRLREIVIEDGLISYEAIARTPVHRRILAGIVPGVLGRYDLPDLAAAIAPRPLTLLDTRTPAGPRALTRDVRDAYEYAVAAYAVLGEEKRLVIGIKREEVQ